MRVFGKFIALLLSSLLSVGTIALAGMTTLYLFYSQQLPDSTELQTIELQVPLRIYSRDEQLIAEYGSKRRRPVKFSDIPPRLRQAFIAIEDARYYSHQGVDLKGVIRAAYNVFSTGRVSQGASTITMQLARNAFLGREKTLERKLKETLLAFKLERTLRKDEILELYLNKIYLGHRAYGVAAAAELYYGKENLADLTLAQMAMIAGLPKAPSRYNPIVNPKRAMIRRDYILKRMWEQGYISQQEYSDAVREPKTAKVHKPHIETYAPYLAEMVRSAIVRQYQDKAYTQGYHVYTTLDSNIQSHAVKALRKALTDYDRRHGYRGAEDQIQLDEYSGREELLDKLSSYRTIADMQAALVVQVSAEQAELLTLDESMDGMDITLDKKAVSWARPFIDADRRGRKPRTVSEVLKVGDIVRIRKQSAGTDQAAADQKNTQPRWQLTQIPEVGGALVVVEPDNGAIRAIMGGFDFYHSKFNRVTQAMRQPGSSFKPLVYSAAMTRGFTPVSIINDAPITVPGSNWQPKNYGGDYIGPTTLAEALAKSRNLVSIRLLRNTGVSYTIDYAMRFGFARKDLPPNLTLALGTGLTTPLQMATAYSAFANGGFKVDAHFINRIEDSTGRILFDAEKETHHACGDNLTHCPVTALQDDEKPKTEPAAETTDNGGNSLAETAEQADTTQESNEPDHIITEIPAAPRIMDSRTNTNIVKMMQGVTQFGTAARIGRTLKRKDVAGKTGTTNDQRDSWFCGFTPDYVAVAWAGFDDMAELGEGETSTRIAVPMWLDLMQEVLKDTPEKSWKTYKKLQSVKLDADTGLVASETSTHVVEEELENTRPVATSNETAHRGFEYTSDQTAAQAARQQQIRIQQQQQLQQQAQNNPYYQPQLLPPPPRQPKSAETVEIPEQIF